MFKVDTCGVRDIDGKCRKLNMRKQKNFQTIREYLYWIYSNLALAHVALKNGHNEYERTDFMIRAKLYKGLCDGKMSIASLYDDEKQKLNTSVCCYCGTQGTLTLDHLIPRKADGSDSGDNIVYACKKCNSSKCDTDLIEWKLNKQDFPPILTLRRYLKIAIAYCEQYNYIDRPFCDLPQLNLPFKIDLLPYDFPAPSNLKL